jgi:hypothetical protein
MQCPECFQHQAAKHVAFKHGPNMGVLKNTIRTGSKRWIRFRLWLRQAADAANTGRGSNVAMEWLTAIVQYVPFAAVC